MLILTVEYNRLLMCAWRTQRNRHGKIGLLQTQLRSHFHSHMNVCIREALFVIARCRGLTFSCYQGWGGGEEGLGFRCVSKLLHLHRYSRPCRCIITAMFQVIFRTGNVKSASKSRISPPYGLEKHCSCSNRKTSSHSPRCMRCTHNKCNMKYDLIYKIIYKVDGMAPEFIMFEGLSLLHSLTRAYPKVFSPL